MVGFQRDRRCQAAGDVDQHERGSPAADGVQHFHAVEQTLAQRPVGGLHVQTQFNPFYQVTDNLITVWLAREMMSEDFILLNGDTLFDAPALEQYAALGQVPVEVDPENVLSAVTRANVVRADVASATELVRHDSLKLATELQRLLDRAD